MGRPRKNELPAIVDRVLKAAGGPNKLAAALGLWPQAIYNWKRIPREHIRVVHTLTKIPLRELAPDVYPETEKGDRRADSR